VTDCPQHHYCVEGSATPEPCPDTVNTVSSGTYFPSTNAQSEDDCLGCPRGEWCNYYAYYSVTALASYDHTAAEAGYRGYCTGAEICSGGAVTDNQALDAVTACTAGYYCPDEATTGEPTLAEKRCPPGTYSAVSATSCTDCVAGTLCDAFGTDDTSQTPCPSGYICPTTGMVSAYQCYPGTYMPGASTGSLAFTDCESCTNDDTSAHYGFCPEYGMTAPQQSSALAVEDGYKADDYLDSATPYYDSRLDTLNEFSEYSTLYFHFEWLNTGASEATLEGLAKA